MQESVERTRELFDEIVLAPDDNRSFSIGKEERVPLNSQEFRLLLLLRKKRGAVVPYQEIMDFLYGEPEGDLPLSDVLPVKIARLRKKLENASKKRFGILAATTIGYQLTDAHHPELLNSIFGRSRPE